MHNQAFSGRFGQNPRLTAAVYVSAVLDATDQQYMIVVEDSESHTIVTAPRDVPSS